MTNDQERILALLQEARRQLEVERKRRREPIAIIGVGCRFPGGASSPAELWQMLVGEVDATSEVPADRWDVEALYDSDADRPGKVYVKRGAFLDRIDGFDPMVFGISPREAIGLDPQQRLLLEVTWEALENANIPVESLNGSSTGVWVGQCLDDYARRSIMSGDLERIDAYNALGNQRSIAAGRIAYVLGLHGPAIQLDTACSSSLVALHLASQSLRAGECDLAIVGGVNLMSSPEVTVGLCRLKALARDGRCKTFDAEADGYGRGEGCGVVVLRRLSDAQAAGQDIWAVVRGSAVNHDGRSNGLTAPNGVAQEAVIRAALANGGVEPAQVGYVEVHGTGTPLGDPIEVLALGRVFGPGRAPNDPLYLGSIKTNVGHLEGAAGIAGIIKTTLCLAKQRMVAHLHFRHPNPRIPWSELPIQIALHEREWTQPRGQRLAGVSSFGISGTNAHVLLEEPPAREAAKSAPARSGELMVLSAKSPAALRQQALRLARHLEVHPRLELADVAYTQLTGRSSLDYRWACVAETRSALIEMLDGASEVDSSTVTPSVPKIVFVFPGQGAQWLGMGRQLLDTEPAFRAALTDCDEAIRAEVGWSVIDSLRAPEEASRLDQIEVVQPVTFAIQVALAALWRAWGVEPEAVVGHSMGEVAAACVSGALSLGDGVAIICRRSALLRRIRGRGEMALVELSMEEAEAAISGFEGRLGVAVSNARRSTVLSGDPAALAEVLARLETAGVFCRRVKVDVASHSPQVDSLLAELVDSLAGIAPSAAGLVMHSTVTGETVQGPELSSRYWADNLRRPVRFEQSIRWLMSKGFTLFVEISPHPMLSGAIDDIRRDVGASGAAVASLRRRQPERLALLESLGAMYRLGLPLDAKRLFPDGGRSVQLPTYPWQRERYWLEAPTQRAGAAAHPFLGVRQSSPIADAVFESFWSRPMAPWLHDHRVGGRAVMPGAMLAELSRLAGEEYHAGAAGVVRGLVLRAPLVIPEHGKFSLQIVLTDGGGSVAIYGRSGHESSASEWVLHATATLSLVGEEAPVSVELASIVARCTRELDVDTVQAAYARLGIDYGPSFRGLRSLRTGPSEVLAEVEIQSGIDAVAFGLHPALLDAALQAALGLADLDTLGEAALLPFEVEEYSLYQLGATAVRVHVQLVEPATADGMLVHATLLDRDGLLVARLAGLLLRRTDVTAFTRVGHSMPHGADFYRLDWREAPRLEPSKTLTGRWLVVASDEARPDDIVNELRHRGANACRIDAQALSSEQSEHVLCVWTAVGDVDAAMRAAVEGLEIVKALHDRGRVPRLWWVTRDAVAVAPNEEVAVAGSTIWGLGRTVAQEKPELKCTLLDLDKASPLLDALLGELDAGGHEIQVARRAGRRYVARLIRASELPVSLTANRFPPSVERGLSSDSGTVLITGGLGALGGEVARSLARRGARHLLLMSRRGADASGAPELVAELETLGARVTIVAGDVSVHDDVARALRSIPSDYPLRGLVHAAGFLDDGVIDSQTAERFVSVMSPKVRGAWHLHALTRELDLDFFVMFSSLAGTTGSAGQSGYAAANTFLDALAAHRRSFGLAGLSLAWGPWAQDGLVAELPTEMRARLSRLGFGSMAIVDGRALFERALARPEAHLCPAAIDLRQVAKSFDGRVPSLWQALLRRSLQAPPKGAEEIGDLADLTPEQQVLSLLKIVREEVARVLSLSNEGSVHREQPLKELGVDSLMAVELRNALGNRTGLRLSATLLFQHPTASSIARYLLERMREPFRQQASEPSTAALGECLRPLPSARFRLFGFHDAGGSAGLFTPFCRLEAEGVEIHAVSNARNGSLEGSGARYLRDAVEYIRPFSTVPYVLFGHSLGSLFAWRVLKAIARERLPLPSVLVLSAAVRPEAVARANEQQGLADTFNAVLGARATMSEALRNDFEADLLLWSSIPATDREPVAVPIVAFAGRDDHVTSEAAMASWEQETTAGFTLITLPGGHFYLTEEGPLELMLEELRRTIR